MVELHCAPHLCWASARAAVPQRVRGNDLFHNRQIALQPHDLGRVGGGTAGWFKTRHTLRVVFKNFVNKIFNYLLMVQFTGFRILCEYRKSCNFSDIVFRFYLQVEAHNFCKPL